MKEKGEPSALGRRFFFGNPAMQKENQILGAMDALTPTSAMPHVDWDSISGMWEILRTLDSCPQDPVHHAEGDVDIHTRMVLDALVSGDAWQQLDSPARFRLFWAAVFHDSGKPATTVHEPDGRITSAGHSRVGAAIFRELMWKAGMPLGLREEICAIITAHQLPFWLYERQDAEKVACRFSLSGNASELMIHAAADARGRICADQQDMLDRVELSRTVFQEMGIETSPFVFVNDESRFAYFEKEDRNPWYAAHEDFRCEATLVCGLPGTGKDTWIAKNMVDKSCVSLDRLREEMDVDPTDNQGQVIQAGFEEARSHLRAGRDFVWNATNVTRNNREKVIRLIRDYGARIKIVYLEVTPDRLLSQNASRAAAVPVDAIMRLARKLEPPQQHEGHEVCWFQNGSPVHARGLGTHPTPPEETGSRLRPA